MKMKYWRIVITLALTVYAASSNASLVVYDDFSSGDLSKWNSTVGTKTTGTVTDNTLYWQRNNTNPGYGVETLISTQSDFDLTASAATPLEVSFKIIDIQNAITSIYTQQRLGWQDETGDTLSVYLLFGAAANPTGAQFWYNGSQLGSTVTWPDMRFDAGDAVSLSYDGSKVWLYRERSTVTSALWSAPFSDASFAGSGSIYLAQNNPGGDGAITIDDISISAAAVPEPATMGLLGLAVTWLLVARRLLV
jgi:hypothetical protein